MGRKRKPRPRGKQAGKALSPVQKEQIRQTFMLTSNKRETARLCSVSEKSVYNVLNEAEDPEVTRNRARAANALSGQVHAKATRILDSINDDDFQSGYLRDEDGELKFDRQGRPIWMGPTLNQKVVGSAILVDKLPVLEDWRQKLEGNNEGIPELMTPESIKMLTQGIQAKVKNMRFLSVEFRDSPQEKAAEELLKKAQQEIEAEEAEYEDIPLDFDNPGS